MQLRSVYYPGERYPSLRIIAAIYSVLGAIFLAIGTVALLIAVAAFAAGAASSLDDNMSSLALGLVGGVWSLLWSFALLLSGLFCVGAGSLLRLMIRVEENTRAAAQFLSGLHSAHDAPSPSRRIPARQG